MSMPTRPITTTPARTRMSRADRRAQLIELGLQAVMGSSFDEVSVEQVADAAGISRGLLFHYFPTRRDFLAAIARAGANELLDVTQPDPSLPPLERLQRSLDGFVSYVEERRDAYTAVVRGAAGGDPAMLEVVRSTKAAIVERTLDSFDTDSAAGGALRLAVHGWIGFLEEATIAWLDRSSHDVSRASLLQLCESMLLAVFTTLGIDPLAAAGSADPDAATDAT